MTLATEIDHRHLARAIELAEQGRGHVSPNPLVGAVIGRDDAVIAEGFHRAAGEPHAEVEAIRSAGRTRTSTARRCTSRSSRAAITAEPGRAPTRSSRPESRGSSSGPTTPASMHPAAGSGSCATRASRSCVADGELATRARLQNQPFRKHARTGRPWVLFKSAMTLDGKVATHSGRLEVDLRRGEPQARAPVARRVRRGRGRDRDRARGRPAAHGARGGRRSPAPPDRVRFRWRAYRWSPSSCREPARSR